MKVLVSGNLVEIEEVIKTLDDVNKINNIISEFKTGSTLILRIKDSFAIPSSIIGILIKKKKEGVDIHLEVGSDTLYELLDDLNLINHLNVRKL
jgi:hypothetical protein